jgi:tetratricopeptide (TPR) repeat protein
VPLFFVGLCAAVGVGFARPLWYDPVGRDFFRSLAQLRSEMDRATPDLTRARDLGEEAAAMADRYPRQEAEVHYLLGSSYLFLASAAQPTEALALWQQARKHLEQSDNANPANIDQGRLRYRLANAWFHTGENPQHVLDFMLATVDSADDRVEGYGMITELYLRLPAPNIREALNANQKQLSQPIEDETILAPARLLRGELFLRVKEPALAREALARIPRSAPPEIRTRARLLKAQVAQEEGCWVEAARAWEDVLADKSHPPENAMRVRYQLGQCYQRLDRVRDAQRTWQPVLEAGNEEAQAATLALAGLMQNHDDLTGAMKMYEHFLTTTPSANAYKNTLAPLDDVRSQISKACVLFREKDEFARSQVLARMYAHLAPVGASEELRGEAADAWATKLRAERQSKKAAEQFREAGSAFAARATVAKEPTDRAKWYRKSADRFVQGQEYPRALAVFEQYRQVEADPEKLGESWFAVAKVYHEMIDEPRSTAAFRKCIEFPGPSAFRARLALAQNDIDAGRLDDAEATLDQNLKLDLSSESETHKQSLFTLADLQYRRGKYRLASLRYQEALDHYPADPRAAEARFHLGDCYRLLADLEIPLRDFRRGQTPEAIRHIDERYRRWLMMALANFQKVIDDLSASKTATAISDDDETILRQAYFAAGKCLIDLGRYEEAIRLFELIGVHYRNKIEHLDALREIWRVYWMQQLPEKARETVRKMRVVLNEIDNEEIFKHTRQSKQAWLEWVNWAEGAEKQ